MSSLSRPRTALALAGLLALAAAAFACSSGDPSPSASPSGAAAPSGVPAATATSTAVNVVLGIPLDPQAVAKVVNPKNLPPYSGPTGTLRGVIRIKGDPPPNVNVKAPDSDCPGEGMAVHGKLFRVGQDGALADAFVTVIGYDGYVPPADLAKRLTIHGCAFSKRTVVATLGQRIEVSNVDRLQSYMPYLDGAPSGVVLVAVPGGDPVRLYASQPGHYLIRDQLPRDHMTADVFVLAFATHDVTGLDGRYEIKGIPVGPVQVNAVLPATNKSVGQRIEIKAGDNSLDLTLSYDAKVDKPKKGTSGDPMITPPGDAKDDKKADDKKADDKKADKPLPPK